MSPSPPPLLLPEKEISFLGHFFCLFPFFCLSPPLPLLSQGLHEGAFPKIEGGRERRGGGRDGGGEKQSPCCQAINHKNFQHFSRHGRGDQWEKKLLGEQFHKSSSFPPFKNAVADISQDQTCLYFKEANFIGKLTLPLCSTFKILMKPTYSEEKKGGRRKRGEGGRRALKTSSFSFPLRRVFLLQKAFFNLPPSFLFLLPNFLDQSRSPFISDGGKRRGKLFRLPKKRGGRRVGGSRPLVFTHNKGGKGGTADGGGPFLKKSCGREESAVCGGKICGTSPPS